MKAPNKFDKEIQRYLAQGKELGIDMDLELLTKIARDLGPSIYLKDASMVACSDPKELERVKVNFVEKKLGVSGKEADELIEMACNGMRKSKKKSRAVFYYILYSNLFSGSNQYYH